MHRSRAPESKGADTTFGGRRTNDIPRARYRFGRAEIRFDIVQKPIFSLFITNTYDVRPAGTRRATRFRHKTPDGPPIPSCYGENTVNEYGQ